MFIEEEESAERPWLGNDSARSKDNKVEVYGKAHLIHFAAVCLLRSRHSFLSYSVWRFESWNLWALRRVVFTLRIMSMQNILIENIDDQRKCSQKILVWKDRHTDEINFWFGFYKSNTQPPTRHCDVSQELFLMKILN